MNIAMCAGQFEPAVIHKSAHIGSTLLECLLDIIFLAPSVCALFLLAICCDR